MEGDAESAPGGLSVETPADTSCIAAALCNLSGRALPEEDMPSRRSSTSPQMQGQGALSTSSITSAPNRANNTHQPARVHLRNLPSALRNSFYHTEEDLKRCERVKSTTKIPRTSTRVWVKYTDGMWAATVTEVNAPGTSFVVKFEYNNSTETIVAKGRDRVHVYFEDLGQLSHTQRSSRFRGVSWKRDSSRWQVHIKDRKNTRYLGTFRLEEEEAAALAYDREARRLGRTKLNFPDRALGPTATVSDTSNREITQGFEPVKWSDIIPFRGYARDSEQVSGRAAELVQLNSHMKTRDDLLFARRTPRWEGLVSRQQIFSMAQHPERITSFVQVARIIDKTNRAYRSDKRGNPTGFATLAAKDIEAYTVLGTYGGITARTSDLDEDTALVESGENYSFSLDLTAQWKDADGKLATLTIDGSRMTNELAMVNDYRTDIHRYADESAQNSKFNAEPMEVWLPGDAVPRVMYVATHHISNGSEILIDYGDSFWKTYLINVDQNDTAAKSEHATVASDGPSCTRPAENAHDDNADCLQQNEADFSSARASPGAEQSAAGVDEPIGCVASASANAHYGTIDSMPWDDDSLSIGTGVAQHCDASAVELSTELEYGVDDHEAENLDQDDTAAKSEHATVASDGPSCTRPAENAHDDNADCLQQNEADFSSARASPGAEQSAAGVDEPIGCVASASANAHYGTIDSMPWDDDSLSIGTDVARHCDASAVELSTELEYGVDDHEAENLDQNDTAAKSEHATVASDGPSCTRPAENAHDDNADCLQQNEADFSSARASPGAEQSAAGVDEPIGCAASASANAHYGTIDSMPWDDDSLSIGTDVARHCDASAVELSTELEYGVDDHEAENLDQDDTAAKSEHATVASDGPSCTRPAENAHDDNADCLQQNEADFSSARASPGAEQSAAGVDEPIGCVASASANAHYGTIDSMPWDDDSLSIGTDVARHCDASAVELSTELEYGVDDHEAENLDQNDTAAKSEHATVASDGPSCTRPAENAHDDNADCLQQNEADFSSARASPGAEQSAAGVDEPIGCAASASANAHYGTIDSMPWDDDSLSIGTDVARHCDASAVELSTELEYGVDDHEAENLDQDDTAAKSDVEMNDRSWLSSLKQRTKVAAHDGSCWLPARVRKQRGQKVFIHYIGWDKQHDEWLPKSLDRIRPIESIDELAPKPTPGCRVRVDYIEGDSGTAEYLGTVTEVHGWEVHILYDDDQETDCIDWSDPTQRRVVTVLEHLKIDLPLDELADTASMSPTNSGAEHSTVASDGPSCARPAENAHDDNADCLQQNEADFSSARASPGAEQSAAGVDEPIGCVASASANAHYGTIDSMPWDDDSLSIGTDVARHCDASAVELSTELEYGVDDHEAENLDQDDTAAKSDVETNDRSWLSSLKQRTKVVAHDGSCWLPARVRKQRGQKVFIHYIGWDKQHDEWLPKSLDRIRPIESIDELAPKPTPGCRVRVDYIEGDSGTAEYLGTVTEVHGWEVHILYDDDQETDCIDWSDPTQRRVVTILGDQKRTYSQRRREATVPYNPSHELVRPQRKCTSRLQGSTKSSKSDPDKHYSRDRQLTVGSRADKVVNFLRDHPGGHTRVQIQERVGTGETTTWRDWSEIDKDVRLYYTGRGVAGHPRMYFAVEEQDSDSELSSGEISDEVSSDGNVSDDNSDDDRLPALQGREREAWLKAVHDGSNLMQDTWRKMWRKQQNVSGKRGRPYQGSKTKLSKVDFRHQKLYASAIVAANLAASTSCNHQTSCSNDDVEDSMEPQYRHYLERRKNGKRCASFSRYIGVTRNDGNTWKATIATGNKGYPLLYLGNFSTELKAARAFDAAARKLCNKRARLRLNFPTRLEQPKYGVVRMSAAAVDDAKAKGFKSQYLGVFWGPRRARPNAAFPSWYVEYRPTNVTCVQIRGPFEDEESAARAFDEMARGDKIATGGVGGAD